MKKGREQQRREEGDLIFLASGKGVTPGAARRTEERERRITEWEIEATGGEEATAARKHDRKTANRTADSGDHPPTADPGVPPHLSISISIPFFLPLRRNRLIPLCAPQRARWVFFFGFFLSALSLSYSENLLRSRLFRVNKRRGRGRRGGLVPSPRNRPTVQVLLGTIIGRDPILVDQNRRKTRRGCGRVGGRWE